MFPFSLTSEGREGGQRGERGENVEDILNGRHLPHMSSIPAMADTRMDFWGFGDIRTNSSRLRTKQ